MINGVQLSEPVLQSYLDLSLLSVIGGAVVLLILILVSFILTSRRCGTMENTLQELKKAFADLKVQQSRIEEAVIAIERKGQAQDRTVSYLTDTRQSLDDKIAEVEKVLDNLSSKLEQQNKVIAENNTQTQPINEAARMLRRGASMEEVIAKTGLPRNEIEMLSSVHGFNKPENSENHSESVHIVKPDQVSPEVQVNARSDQPRPAGIQSGHVAGLKARNAYGIPAGHHSLRRTR